MMTFATRRVRWSLAPRGAALGGDWREREAILVALRCDDGATGLGEAAPLPGMSKETIEDAERALARLASDVARGDDVARARIATVAREMPSAAFALETALAVVAAQRSRTSVAGILGGEHEVRACAIVDDEHDVVAAPVVKIKVGAAAFTDDLARVRRIARAHPSAAVRVDANRRWPRADTRTRLAALADALGDRLEYVEEPCANAYELLAEPLACRIALDESLVTLTATDVAAALRSPSLAALVLKPTLLGGFARCLELAATARAHGKWPVVTHALEGAVGRAACTELARAVGGPP